MTDDVVAGGVKEGNSVRSGEIEPYVLRGTSVEPKVVVGACGGRRMGVLD